jgi:hypothetical protein
MIKRAEGNFVSSLLIITIEVIGRCRSYNQKLTGSYGSKYKGSIDASESIITLENGFKNIIILGEGCSPINYIEKLLGN